MIALFEQINFTLAYPSPDLTASQEHCHLLCKWVRKRVCVSKVGRHTAENNALERREVVEEEKEFV